MVDLSIFLGKGVFDILIYLLDYPEGRQKVDFRKDLKLFSNTQITAHKTLLEEKLIDINPNPDKILFKLTEKGKKIAELLKQIQQI